LLKIERISATFPHVRARSPFGQSPIHLAAGDEAVGRIAFFKLVVMPFMVLPFFLVNFGWNRVA